MQDRSLIDKLLEEAAWEGKDAFPSTAEWRKDICDLLEFLEKEGQLERHWPALTSERPRLDHVRAALLKASDQLPEDSPTLVAIVDDLYWSPAEEFPANVLVPTLKGFFETSELW